METLFDLSPLIMGIVPLVMALVEAAKQMAIPSKYAPVAAMVFGVGLVALTGASWPVYLVQGIIAGLLASGLYSGGKAVSQG